MSRDMLKRTVCVWSLVYFSSHAERAGEARQSSDLAADMNKGGGPRQGHGEHHAKPQVKILRFNLSLMINTSLKPSLLPVFHLMESSVEMINTAD